MLDISIADKVIKRALRDGGDFAELFVESRRGYSLRLEEEKVEDNSTGLENGAGVRILYGESMAYAYTNDLSEASLLETAAICRRGGAEAQPGSRVVDLTAPLAAQHRGSTCCILSKRIPRRCRARSS